MNRSRAWWREPLLHFLVVGAGLFFVYEMTRADDPDSARRIVVDAGQMNQLVAKFERTWLRPPTDTELQRLVEGHVREEIYYREALALGLDRNDPQVRQRLRLKLEFLLDDLASQDPPDDSVLADHLQRNAQDFLVPPRFSFQQVYLNPERHADVDSAARRLLVQLRSGTVSDQLGDPSVLPRQVRPQTRSQIAVAFGDAFASEVVTLDPGEWTGPVHSALGAHLVRVLRRQPGRLPDLEEIRPQLEREVVAERRQQSRQAAYERLRQHYEVIVETPEPSDTVAVETPDAGRNGAAR